MFLYVSVILFTGGDDCLLPGWSASGHGRCIPPWTHTSPGTPTWTKKPKNTLLDTHTPDTTSGHTHPWSHTPENTHTSGQTSPLTHIPGHIHPIGMAVEAGSTHPTGMRSCYIYEVEKYSVNFGCCKKCCKKYLGEILAGTTCR